jgi:hypothetical protein
LDSSLVIADDGSDKPGLSMAVAAQKLIDVLPADQKQKLMYKYDDPERVNWHFIPKDRNGIVLWDLNGEPKKVAEDLVKVGLSAAGHARVLQVRSLEEVLYLFEAGEEDYRPVRPDMTWLLRMSEQICQPSIPRLSHRPAKVSSSLWIIGSGKAIPTALGFDPFGPTEKSAHILRI